MSRTFAGSYERNKKKKKKKKKRRMKNLAIPTVTTRIKHEFYKGYSTIYSFNDVH